MALILPQTVRTRRRSVQAVSDGGTSFVAFAARERTEKAIDAGGMSAGPIF
jgi:hypothetical protein